MVMVHSVIVCMFYLRNLWSCLSSLSCACVGSKGVRIESEGCGCVVNIMVMFVLSAFSGGMGWNPIEYD